MRNHKITIIIVDPNEYPTPKPIIKTLLPGCNLFSKNASFKAIGIEQETVFPFFLN